MKKPALSLVAAALAVSLLAPHAPAQVARLTEDFEDNGAPGWDDDGPPNLEAAGWIFRSQSTPAATGPAWWDSFGYGANTGDGHLTSVTTHNGPMQLANWAILPEVDGQAAGDVLSFWVLGGDLPPYALSLEVRYSPSGSTDTGSGPSGVGAFTQVLASHALPLTQGFTYAPVSVTLPGAGRIALRHVGPNIGHHPWTSSTLLIDTLAVGEDPGPACGAPLPEAGGSVTWTAAGAPYTICQDLTIPEGATLNVEPGASLHFEAGKRLYVEGALQMLGTAVNPIVVTADSITGFHVRGEARFEHVDGETSVMMSADGSFEAYDCLFRENGRMTPIATGAFVRLERCELRSDWLDFVGATVLRDVTFTTTSATPTLRGFWSIEDLESSAPLAFIGSLQDRVIDNVTVTGVTWAPALELDDYTGCIDFELGPGNVLQGNQYPVWARYAGLRRTSVVPATGNLENAILGPEVANASLRSRVTLPDLGVPYDFLDLGTLVGDVRVDPGTRFRMGPLGAISVGGDQSTDTLLRGLPGAPLRFEPLVPGQSWRVIANAFGLTIFEHLDIRGADIGVNVLDTLLLRDCAIRDCGRGVSVSAGASLRADGNLVAGNQVGMRLDGLVGVGGSIDADGAERPNTFVDNDLAAENQASSNGTLFPFGARRNWWGHPTGPYEQYENPGGAGDPITHGIEFQPFLTGRPDLSDTRPVVRLTTRLHPAVVSGDKVFVEWTAEDDGVIESFDLQWFDPQALAFVDLATDLPGTARRHEIVVPDIGIEPNFPRMPLRILAHDDAGQTGIEQFWLIVPANPPTANVTFTTPLGGFRGGERIEVCYQATGLQGSASLELRVETSSDDRIGPSVAGYAGCSLSTVEIPHASTDRARIVLRADGTGSRDEWYFSDWFTIRPDPRLGDEAPAVAMLAPLAGQTFAGGDEVEILWDASDDRGLAEFRVQASLDGGRTFHTVADELPAEARSYTWRLPPSTGVDDVRVRVVAVDTFLQNTADGDDRMLTVTPGPRNARRLPDARATQGWMER